MKKTLAWAVVISFTALMVGAAVESVGILNVLRLAGGFALIGLIIWSFCQVIEK